MGFKSSEFLFIFHSRSPSTKDHEEYMKSMLLWAESLHQKVKENIQKAQTKQKKIYDARHKQPTFQVGDKVWQYNSRKQTRQGGKLEFNWDGAYEITEQTTRGTYKLKNKSGMILRQAVSSINLKAFNKVKYLILTTK